MILSIEDTKPELNVAIALPLLDYCRDHWEASAYQRLLERMAIPESYFRDPHHWISYKAYIRMLEIVTEETGDPNAVFTYVRMGVKGRAMGPLRVMGMPVFSIANFYRMTVLCQRSYSRLADWKVITIKAGHARLALEYNHGYPQTRLNCDAIRGFLAGLPQWAGQPPAEVRHDECIVNGAERCVYDVVWKEPGNMTFATLLGFLCLGCFAGGLVELFVPHHITGWLAAPFTGISCLLAGVTLAVWRNLCQVQEQNKQEAEELNRALQSIHQLNDSLHTLVEKRTAELEEALAGLKSSRAKELLIERQAAIGVLASGMAHELNNPLNAVALSLQGIREDVPVNTETHDLVDSAELATRRCRRIVSELLAYSRDSDHRLADVSDIVSTVVSAFRIEQPGGVSVSLDVAAGTIPVVVDRGQLQLALMNLLNNASEAMGGQGKIMVRVWAEGGHVWIVVKDTGPGMNEEVRKRVFDPFFTTKPQGKGTGLGLAITWQLIQRCGGTIDVKSHEGQGSEFVVSLPFSREKEKV